MDLNSLNAVSHLPDLKLLKAVTVRRIFAHVPPNLKDLKKVKLRDLSYNLVSFCKSLGLMTNLK